MRSYYCKSCQKVTTFDTRELVKKCSCSYIFENNVNKGHQINMRKTWSGTSKIEFSATTVGQDIIDRGGSW